MPGATDIYNSIAKARAEEEATRKQDTYVMAQTLIAAIKDRVQQRGVKATGGSFSDYTESYAKFRRRHHRPTARKVFTFTGEMWKKMVPIFTAEGEHKVTWRMGNKVALYDEKVIAAHGNREGISILALSPDDQQLKTEIEQDRFIRILNKYGIPTR